MKIADAHTHIFPEKIAVKATKSIGDFYESDMFADAAVSKLIESENSIGTEKYLVCSSAVTAEQVTSINNFISNECKRHPCFLGLAALHPDTFNYEEELDRAVELGLKGVKFHPDFQRFNMDDDKAIPMYRAIARRNLPVLFHMGDDRYDFSAPKRLINICRQVPDLIAIGAHFGGYRRWDEAYSMPKNDNIFYDTSSSLAFLDKDKALRMIERFGADHFMFGSDFPMWNPKKELERFLALGLDDKQNEDILYNNFNRLFK